MSKNRDEVFADKDEVFANKDEVFANENPYFAEIDRLVGELNETNQKSNRSSKKLRGESSPNTAVLFVPLIIGTIVFLIAFIFNTCLYLSRPADRFELILSDKNNIYDSADYVEIKIDIENNSSKNIEGASFLMILEDDNGHVLLDTVVNISGSLSKGSSSSATQKIMDSKFMERYVNMLDYDGLWESDLSNLNASFELISVQYQDGKTLLYNENAYMRNSALYTNILVATFAISVGWLVYCFMTRCPHCRRFIAMKSAGKKETGRKAGSSVVKKAFTDQYGNEIRDQHGNKICYEETVQGYDVNYTYYHRCKYCNHISSSRGSEFEH